MGQFSKGASTRLRVAASVMLASVLAVAVAVGTHSAFTNVDTNAGNSVSAAQLNLASQGAVSGLLGTITGLLPLQTITNCVQLVYTGPSATVAMAASANTTGLAPYLNLQIVRGTFAGGVAAANCTGFTPDATGNPVFNAALNTLTAPITDSNTTWGAAGATTKVAYEFITTQLDNNLAQGLSSSPSFTWTATNN